MLFALLQSNFVLREHGDVSFGLVAISDALARLANVEPLTQLQVDISMLPPGMHHVQLWTGDHMRYARIVKH